MKLQTDDYEIVQAMTRTYLSAIAILETRTPDEITKNGREACVIIDKVRGALLGNESFTALSLAFAGFLVALADEPEAAA